MSRTDLDSKMILTCEIDEGTPGTAEALAGVFLALARQLEEAGVRHQLRPRTGNADVAYATG